MNQASDSLALIRMGEALMQMRKDGGEQDTAPRIWPWGLEVDVSYPGTWKRLWLRKRRTLMSTHDGRLLTLKPHGRLPSDA